MRTSGNIEPRTRPAMFAPPPSSGSSVSATETAAESAWIPLPDLLWSRELVILCSYCDAVMGRLMALLDSVVVNSEAWSSARYLVLHYLHMARHAAALMRIEPKSISIGVLLEQRMATATTAGRIHRRALSDGDLAPKSVLGSRNLLSNSEDDLHRRRRRQHSGDVPPATTNAPPPVSPHPDPSSTPSSAIYYDDRDDPFNLAETVAVASALLSDPAAARKVSIGVDCPNAVIVFRGSRIATLRNLLTVGAWCLAHTVTGGKLAVTLWWPPQWNPEDMSPPPPTAAYPRHRQSSSSGHPETSAVGQQEEEDVAHYPIVTFRSMPIYPNVREDVRSAIFRTATMASPCSRLAHHVAIRYSCISEEEELVLGDDEGRTAEVKASMLVVELRLPLTLATPGDLQAHTPSAPEHDDNNTEGASASPLQRRLSQPSLLLTPPPALSVSLRKFAQSLFGYPVGVFPFPGVIYPLRTLGLLPYSIRDLSRFPRLSIVRAPIGLLKKMYTALRRLPRHIPVGILAIVEGPEEAMDMVQWLDRSAKRGWPSDAADEDLMLSLHAGPGSGGSIASGSSTTHPSPSLDFLRSASSTLTPVPSSWAGSNLFMETSPSLALHLNPLPQSAVTLLEGLMGLNASIKMLESNMTLGSSNTNPSRGPLPMRLHAPGAAGPTSLAPWSRGSLPMSSPEITEWERVMEMGKQCESSPMPSTGSVPMSPGAQVAASAAAAKELAEKTSCDKRRSAPDRATSLPADPWSAPKDGWIPLHLVEIGMEPVVPALVVLGGNAGLEVPPTMGSILATSCTAGISSFDDLRQRDAVSAGAELWVGAIGGGRLRGGSGAGSGPRSRSLALRTLREDSIQALLRSVKVLVAEDDRVLSKILCKYLEQRGVRYRAAPNGPTALTEFVDQGPFQLMLLNLRLENTMSGFECAERVRAIERDARDRLLGTSPPVSPLMPPPPLPCTIIGITSETTATVHHAARLAGCNDVVIKPVNLQWIENKILECASLVALVTTPLSETEELRASPLPRRAETVTRMQPPPLPHHPHSSVLDL